jgi:hypothetical protein
MPIIAFSETAGEVVDAAARAEGELRDGEALKQAAANHLIPSWLSLVE